MTKRLRQHIEEARKRDACSRVLLSLERCGSVQRAIEEELTPEYATWAYLYLDDLSQREKRAVLRKVDALAAGWVLECYYKSRFSGQTSPQRRAVLIKQLHGSDVRLFLEFAGDPDMRVPVTDLRLLRRKAKEQEGGDGE